MKIKFLLLKCMPHLKKQNYLNASNKLTKALQAAFDKALGYFGDWLNRGQSSSSSAQISEILRILEVPINEIHKILNLQENATMREIKESFFDKLFGKVHPSLNSGKAAEEAFSKLYYAYQELMKKGQYCYHDIKNPKVSSPALQSDRVEYSKLLHATNFILTEKKLYPDINMYPPDDMTKDDWEDDHLYHIRPSKILTHKIQDNSQEEPEKILEKHKKEMIDICSKGEKNLSIVLAVDSLAQGTVEWDYREPFIFKIEKFSPNLPGIISVFQQIRIFSISYLYKSQEFCLLKIDFGAITTIRDFVFHLLNFFTPLNFFMSMGSICRIEEYTDKMKDSFALSYFPQISETFREMLYLIWSKPEFGSFDENLRQFFPIIMNFIFAITVIKKINVNFGKSFSSRNAKDEFDAVCKHVFASEFFNELNYHLNNKTTISKEISPIIDNFLPKISKNIIVGYLAIVFYKNDYEVLIRPQVLSLLEKKLGPSDKKDEKEFEPHLNRLFAELKKQTIISAYMVIESNTAFNKETKKIVEYNGCFLKLNYGDIKALHEYLEYTITLPMYPLGKAKQKSAILNNICGFLNTKKNRLAPSEQMKFVEEMERIGSGMQNYPIDFKFMPGQQPGR